VGGADHGTVADVAAGSATRGATRPRPCTPGALAPARYTVVPAADAKLCTAACGPQLHAAAVGAAAGVGTAAVVRAATTINLALRAAPFGAEFAAASHTAPAIRVELFAAAVNS
jgi:hypothetical protein